MSLTTGQKAGWGLADMGIVVFVIVKQLLILAFMNSFLGIPIAMAGAITTAVLVFDIISDPIIGYFSDKTVSRLGRRAPWMLLGAVILAVAIIGLFAVPEGFGTNESLIWVTIFFLIATLGFTMVSIPYGAMAGEMTLDELLDKRLNRVYQGVINDDQGEFGPHWYGGFMGLNDGEQLNLMLSIKSFHPIGDGRWQIQAEELDDIDLDRLVFGKLNDGPLSDENEVRFILRSGRLLALDLLLLEALLIVDEQPRGDVLHIQWDMVSDPGMSSLSSPAWTSRPDSVSSEDWRRVTTAVKPDLLSVSFCDCGIDAMELSIRSNSPSANDLITPKGIETSNGLIPNDFWVAVLGFAVLIAAAVVEKERRDKGMSLASQILN